MIGGAVSSVSPQAGDRPNVLLICTDQQRFDTLAGYGNTEIDTPNLDRLATDGALFENCYVQAPVCAPSRASLMSGMYLHNHGLYANGVRLPESVRLLPTALAETGYDCGLVGKWHLDACADGRTEDKPAGFRVWQWAHDPYRGSSENAYHRWLATAHPEVYDLVLGQRRDRNRGRTAGVAGSPIDVVPTEAHYSRWVGDETIRYLTGARPAEQPFFFVANFFDPHHSFGAPKEYLERYRPEELSRPNTVPGELDAKPPILAEASARSYSGHAAGYQDYSADDLQQIKAAYYAMVSLIDDEVGRILRVLHEQGLDEHTVVIFTSDHGELLGDHQLMLKGPMMYDCSVRVPLLIRWPGRIAAQTKITELVQWIDLTATIAELTGASLPRCQGRSLLGLADGSASEHRGWALCEYRDSGHPYDPPVHTTMVRRGDIKIIIHHGQPCTTRRRTGELYDLATDPGELMNLWDRLDHAELRQEMTEFAFDVMIATDDRSQPRKAFW
ncbi:sulfatase-like hydrolase/transferase [Microlunatus elymi]|uniref:Sulfatase-like hydrolase/transferase n=1 Tax=Microlunatus elymi TaxID=2596828 RepID=A0A516PY88_9ACTN|nr:sulfatase-like hydrolase/transferase [Microlunatus elymi]QDP96130.1 sulfatase-like hydrolase/transferase [Microlunatus elymi]